MPDVVIKARHNGPYLVTGPITLTDADGIEYTLPEGETIALCRCGGSANKPFCDSTHKAIGFQAPERVARVLRPLDPSTNSGQAELGALNSE